MSPFPLCERLSSSLKITMAERFWIKVAIGDPDECWEWTRGCDDWGYGVFRVAMNRSPQKASRVAYWLTKGDIPEGLLVLHQCDNPPCCNPKHLFLGTHKDNCDDKMRKGRFRPNGSRAGGRQRLTNDQILEVRRRVANGESQGSIAKEFNVAKSTIHRYVNIWKGPSEQ